MSDRYDLHDPAMVVVGPAVGDPGALLAPGVPGAGGTGGKAPGFSRRWDDLRLAYVWGPIVGHVVPNLDWLPLYVRTETHARWFAIPDFRLDGARRAARALGEDPAVGSPMYPDARVAEEAARRLVDLKLAREARVLYCNRFGLWRERRAGTSDTPKAFDPRFDQG